MRARLLTAAVVFLLASGAAPSRAGEIIVQFFAAPGTGFADPTPAAPVGGNPGLTLGQQRIFVFLQAAALWTEVLQPEQDIFVAAQFQALPAGVLGSAGAQFIWSNFTGAELPNTWYFDSLADNLFQGDLSPPPSTSSRASRPTSRSISGSTTTIRREPRTCSWWCCTRSATA